MFWLGLSAVGDGVTTVALPARLLAAGRPSATLLGLLTAASLLLAALAQPFAGAWSDRLRPRLGRMPFIGAWLAALVLALGLLAVVPALWVVALAYVAAQLAASAAQAGQQALLPDLVPPSLRGRASGLKGAMDLGGAMMGFLLLGALLTVGFAVAIGAVAALAVASFALAAILLRGRRGGEGRPPDPVAPLLRALRIDLGRHRRFGRVVASRFLFLLGTYAVGRFFVLFVADRLALPAGRAAAVGGMLLAGLTLLTAVASLPAGMAADRAGRATVMVVGCGLGAAGVLVLVPAASIPAMALGGAVMALGSAAFSAGNWALAADLAPAAEAGRFLGWANLGTAGAAAGAGFLGPLVDLGERLHPGAGFPALFLVAAACFLAAAAAVPARAGAGRDAGLVPAERAGAVAVPPEGPP